MCMICFMSATPSPRSRGTEAFIKRFLSRLPPDAANSFSAAQLAAVQRAFGMRYAVDHAVDMRRSIRLPWGRYYFILIAGRDRQGFERSAMRAVGVLAGASLLALSVLSIAGG